MLILNVGIVIICIFVFCFVLFCFLSRCCLVVVYLGSGMLFEVMYLYVGSGWRDRNYSYDYYYGASCDLSCMVSVFVFLSFFRVVFFPFFFFLLVLLCFLLFFFLEFINGVCGLRLMSCEGIVAYCVECGYRNNIVELWFVHKHQNRGQTDSS